MKNLAISQMKKVVNQNSQISRSAAGEIWMLPSSHYIKYTVNSHIANTELAINCHDLVS
jgi:hypothetical protein